MDVAVTITEYKNKLRALGYSPKTIEVYGWGLDRFRAYLVQLNSSDLRSVTNPMIVSYQASVQSEPLATETKALLIRSVKRLFGHLVSAHRLLIDPTTGIVESCGRGRKVGPVLSIEEIKQLLCRPNLSFKAGIRDRAIMEVLYSTGIRGNELVALQVYDADLRDKVLYIRKGKGRRQRVVPLGKKAVQYLKEYLEKIRSHYARKRRKERRLFLTVSGEAMNTNAVRTMLRGHRTAAGIKKPVSAHTFRRTCATHLLQQGADIRYVQKLLGHKYLKTTQRYTKVAAVDVKKVHESTHPNTQRKSDEDQG